MADKEQESGRGRWGSQLEFVLTTVGCAVGMGNVWRFPFLTYRNGGGAFLIPYFMSMIFLAIPIFALEVTMGQFSSLGPLSIWTINPIFKGLGIAMVVFTTILMSYYAIIIAQFIFFLFASMTSKLPWGSCLNEWNTCNCRLDRNDTSYLNNTHLNCSYKDIGDNASSGSEEYYNNYVLEVSGGMDEPGHLRWQLVLCNLLTWVLTAIILIRGVKSLGKAVYVITLLPYILMTALLVRGVTLEGHEDGVHFYISPNVSKLADASVWGDAVVQIFFSTSTCSGAIMAMASYNVFTNDVFRDSILIPLINCLTSFFAGFATFSVLGFMAANKGTTVDKVTAQGPGLVFVVYPEALSRMPVAPLWAILFFIMMMCLGISSLTSGCESVLTAITDEFPALRKGKGAVFFRLGACFIWFLLGLPHVTQGGSYFLGLIDSFISGFPLLVIGLLEIVVFVYIYGLGRLRGDLELMLGTQRSFTVLYFGFFSWTWAFLCPVLIVVIIVTMSMQYQPVTSPYWAEVLGWLIVAAILGPVPLWYLGYYCFAGGCKLMADFNTPQKAWGPSRPEHRQGRYQDKQPLVEEGAMNMQERGGATQTATPTKSLSGIANLGYVRHREDRKGPRPGRWADVEK